LKFAALIPAYNEAATIRAVAERCLRQVDTLIVVDDGSGDGTADALAGLPLILLRHTRNQGKAASLWDGFRAALELGADAVVTLDGDGQHLPEEIPRLAEAARRHPERLVIGARLWDRAAFPSARYRANRFANFWIGWAAGQRLEDSQSGFRVYPAALLRKLLARGRHAAGFVFESEVIIDAAHLGHPSVPVPVSAIYRQDARASHFHPARDIARIVLMVASKLLARGLYPAGLVRSLRRQP
jgi:glycosyltransferase involved in cell wall biosynthesis